MSKVNRFVKTICCCLHVPRQVNVLTCQDVFDVFACSSMCLSQKCSIKKKVILKRDEDVLGEVKKFCYLVAYLVLTVQQLLQCSQVVHFL